MFLVNLLLAPFLIFSGAATHTHHERPPLPEGGYTGWLYAHAAPAQAACAKTLWTRESNMSPTAQNESSGAYGIPQALPGEKMASAGPDWQTNGYTQMQWGLDYIADRYGTPCAALAHSDLHGWY